METLALPRPQPLWFIDGLVRIHVSGDETDGRYCVLENVVPEGDMPPLHVHHEEDEVFHVLEGRISLFLPRRRVELAAGQTFRAPRGIPHTYRVESKVARMLVVCEPARFDRLVLATADRAPAEELPPRGRPLDAEALGAAAAEAGIELLGPRGALPEG
jgi:mannose-6-phosphate isomerase-like protein (cupin superfamily)